MTRVYVAGCKLVAQRLIGLDVIGVDPLGNTCSYRLSPWLYECWFAHSISLSAPFRAAFIVPVPRDGLNLITLNKSSATA